MVYRKNALLAVVSYAVACSCSSPAVTNQSGGHLTQTDKAAIEWFDTLGFPDLSNCELSDPSPLAELTSLRGLDLTGTRVSEADVRKMQQELPNCYIIDPPGSVTRISGVREITVVAKLAKSFGGAAIPKVLATFATTKSDTYCSNDT